MDKLDKDLESIAETRRLVEESATAGKVLAQCDETTIHRILHAVADTSLDHARELAEMAAQETGFGVVEDKIAKNQFAAKNILDDVLKQKLIGIVKRDDAAGIWEIAVPMGVVAAIIPSTNPTSTAIFKILISLAGRNTVVLSPHPAARNCITYTADLCHRAAVAVGAPPGCIGWQTIPTLEGTAELMQHKKTAVILATGGSAMVHAAYSSGKPAFGVGPGNVPAYVDRSADVAQAAERILSSKCFDNGTICSSEQAIVADEPIDTQLRSELEKRGAYFIPREMIPALEAVVTPGGKLNPRVVGQPVQRIAEWAGITISTDSRCLIVELDGVGRDYPLSCEKLCPILAYYTASDWVSGCERCLEILAYGGKGHSLVIHAQDMAVIERFALEKPVGRLLVNTPSSQGAIGLSTNLTPSLTLGCGSAGGNITTDNVTARHLLQIRRVAFHKAAEMAEEGLTKALVVVEPPPADATDQTAEEDIIRNAIARALAEEAWW
jgi:acetaldehyde dehydrogenase (acetylating)